MFAFITAFLSYKPAVFESTVDRWERKGLLKRFEQPTEIQPSDDASSFERLRKTWDDAVDTTLALRERITAARMSVSGTRYPANRWRLRRLYRWQQRHGDKGPRTTYDELFSEPRSKMS